MSHPPIPENRSLVVIDDARLRRAAAAEAERLLAKIDRLERADRDFFEVDQGLYQSWYELTFRPELRQLNDLREIATKLIRFHNWILTLSQRRRIRPEEAYAILQEEQLRYEVGGAEERAGIEEARRRRDTGEDDSRKARRERNEESRHRAKPGGGSENQRWWDSLLNLSEEELRQNARAFPDAIHLILQAIVRAENACHARIVLLLWGEASAKVKKEAARVFETASGQPMGRVLDQMRAFLAAQEETGEERRRSQPAASAGASLAPRERHEELKQLYRKFVRHLHPDKLAPGEEVSPWQKKIWNEGQEAYRAKNRDALYRLYQIVILRLRRLSELTMGEIRTSHEWLRGELRKLEAATKEKRKAPFWKFSKRKDYFELERQTRKELERDINRMKIEIRKLRDEQEALRLVGEAAERAPRRGDRKPKRSR